MAAQACGKLDINPKKLGKFAGNSVDLLANNRRRKSHPVLTPLIIKLLKIKGFIFVQIFS